MDFEESLRFFFEKYPIYGGMTARIGKQIEETANCRTFENFPPTIIFLVDDAAVLVEFSYQKMYVEILDSSVIKSREFRLDESLAYNLSVFTEGREDYL